MTPLFCASSILTVTVSHSLTIFLRFHMHSLSLDALSIVPHTLKCLSLSFFSHRPFHGNLTDYKLCQT